MNSGGTRQRLMHAWGRPGFLSLLLPVLTTEHTFDAEVACSVPREFFLAGSCTISTATLDHIFAQTGTTFTALELLVTQILMLASGMDFQGNPFW